MTVTACGATGSGSGKGASRSAHTSTRHRKDRDNDEDNNNDDYHVLDFGHVADPTEHQAITTLVSHYFAAAAAENGKRACALLTPFVAESVVEQDGQSPSLRGSSCAQVMTKLFRQEHAELVGKSAHLKVIRVGVEGDRSLVALEFSEIPVVRQITARRVEDRWTVLDLLDGIIE